MRGPEGPLEAKGCLCGLVGGTITCSQSWGEGKVGEGRLRKLCSQGVWA